jgi:hypothetical protein
MAVTPFRAKKGLIVKPQALPTGEAGELASDSGDSNKLKYHNGTSWSLLGGGSSKIVIQDFTSIGTVGSLNQQYAGHIWTPTEMGPSTALYLFKSGDLTTDEMGIYTLTDVGGIVSADGIMGATTDQNAVSFNGTTQYYTAPNTLLSNAYVFYCDMWVMVDPTATGNQFLLHKNDGGTNDLTLYIDYNAAYIMWNVTILGVPILLAAPLPGNTLSGSGSPLFFHLALSKSTIAHDDLQMWVNGRLVAVGDTSAGSWTLGTVTNLFIGSDTSGAQKFSGKLSMLRFISNWYGGQNGTDFAYATKYTAPAFADLDYEVSCFTRHSSALSIAPIQYEWLEVARNINHIYRHGGIFRNFDSLRIISRG